MVVSDTAAPLAARLEWLRAPARLTYLIILLLATLSSIRLDLDPSRVAARMGRMLQPDIKPDDAVDAVRNVVLFAGWGLVWMITAAPGRTIGAIRTATLTGAGISLIVELVQMMSSTRTASVLDLMTNTGGALIGASVLVVMVIATAKRQGESSFVGVPAALFAVAYGVAIVAETAIPLFRQDLLSGLSGGAFSRITGAIDAFQWAQLNTTPFGDVLLFGPLGVFTVAALYESGRSYRAAAVITSIASLGLFPMLEVAHGAAGVPIHSGAAIIHVMAVAAGALMGAVLLPRFSRAFRGVRRPQLLTGCYAVLLLLWVSRPYQVEISGALIVDKLSGKWWLPLGALAGRMDVFSVVDVLAGFFLYLPVGGLLAVWPLRLVGRLRGIVPAVAFVVLTEVTQTFVAYRWPDITDVLVQSAGLAIGWLIVRRAGFKPYGEQLGGGSA